MSIEAAIPPISGTLAPPGFGGLAATLALTIGTAHGQQPVPRSAADLEHFLGWFAGDETGYELELARLTYQNTRVAVLKLGVLDAATGETVAYSWADPDAVRIGINLGWMQAGLTQAGTAQAGAAP